MDRMPERGAPETVRTFAGLIFTESAWPCGERTAEPRVERGTVANQRQRQGHHLPRYADLIDSEMMDNDATSRTAERLSLGLSVAFLVFLAVLHVLEPEFN